jgi:hypothetical protein
MTIAAAQRATAQREMTMVTTMVKGDDKDDDDDDNDDGDGAMGSGANGI